MFSNFKGNQSFANNNQNSKDILMKLIKTCMNDLIFFYFRTSSNLNPQYLKRPINEERNI